MPVTKSSGETCVHGNPCPMCKVCGPADVHYHYSRVKWCGCRLNVSTKLPPITFCQLHTAAGELAGALRDLVQAHVVKMGPSAVMLRVELAKDALKKAGIE